jgi:hypothetical protein
VTLARKQGIADQAAWQKAMDRSRDQWPDARLDRLVDQTATTISAFTAGKKTAVAWSGGKDSLALAWICDKIGITECVLAISDLEYPAFLQSVTDYMPPGLTVISTGQNLAWLRDHPHMLFPQGPYGARWFAIVNHRGQEAYYRQEGLDMLLLGRRRVDGNYCGPAGQVLYANARGVCRYSPLADWPHEAVFSLLLREGITLPPCYGWPRGFQVGTGAWPARQWTDSTDHGFEEVWQIDAGVIRHAATELPQAAEWMARTGRA